MNVIVPSMVREVFPLLGVCVCVWYNNQKAVNLWCLTLRWVSLLNFVVKESLVLGSGSETDSSSNVQMA